MIPKGKVNDPGYETYQHEVILMTDIDWTISEF